MGVAVAACVWSSLAPTRVSAEPPVEAAEARPVVGVLLPLTGKHKRLGASTLDAINLAIGHNQDVEFVVVDTGGDARRASAEVSRLSGDPRVVLLLGPLGWQESRAASEVANGLSMPIVLLSSEQGVEGLGPWVFRGRPSVEEQARYVGTIATTSLQLERFAILVPDDALGRGAGEAFFEAVRRTGGRVVAMSSYARGETNLSHAVEELVGLRGWRLGSKSRGKWPQGRLQKTGRTPNVDFDAVFVPDYDDQVTLAAKFLRFVEVPLAGYGDGSSVQLLGISHMAGAHLADADGLVAGALFSDVFDVESDLAGVDGFVQAYTDAYKREPTDLDAEAHDLVMHVSAAVRVTRGVPAAQERREAARMRLITLKAWTGLTGSLWFEASGAPGRGLQLWVVNASGTVSPSPP